MYKRMRCKSPLNIDRSFQLKSAFRNISSSAFKCFPWLVSAAESMEDIAFQEHRIVKRRLMLMGEESCSEVRRLQIVYFLSRKGRIEHPHLVRVHHHSRNGVRLRDVKRWLGELRGKDMPQLYAWSYKRKYKTGYVWQDLLDDDLITPISNNEYVLKGSEISSHAINKDFSYSEKELFIKKEQSSIESEAKNLKSSSKEESQSHSSVEIEEESPAFSSETSTLTYDTIKLEMEHNPEKIKREKKQEADGKIENPFYSTFLNKKNKSDKVKIKETNNSASASEKSSNMNKSKNQNSNNIFRNLITCGAIDTNESAVVMMNKHNNRAFMSMCSSDEKNVNNSCAEICKRDKFGGSHRILGNPTWTQQQWSRKSCDGVKDSTKSKSEFREQRALYAAAYKPINGPNCSQCGKQFKPEKLHSHMKSCKGMKASYRNAASGNPAMVTPTIETTSQQQSTNSQNENSVSGYLLAYVGS